MTEPVAAIILAAGHSKRMGDFKPLLPIGEQTALEHAVSLFRRAGISNLQVVTGHEGEKLTPLLQTLEVPQVPNPHYREGMFTSIQAGLRTLPEDVAAFFMLPVDIPLIRPQTVKTLLRTWRSGRRGIIQPVFYGTYGHPPLISTRYRQAILNSGGEGGLKKLLLSFAADTLELEVPDEYILLDMDTPEDYRYLCDRLSRRAIPSERECEHLLAHEFNLPQRIVAHCRQVARIATRLSDQLREKGEEIDRDLVLAAALLHDCARQEPHHARAGEKALRLLGFPAVAEVVGRHMDLNEPANNSISASEIVYLADKLTAGDRQVRFEERFDEKRRRYADQPEVLKKIDERMQSARRVQQRLESLLGCSLDKVLSNPEQSEQRIIHNV
jgi:molybdenum cofactor cytidylyltransferase